MKNIKKIILIASLVLTSLTASAQGLGDAVYFSSLPEAATLNPALHGNNKLYFYFPLLGKFGANFNTSGFAWNDLVNQHPVYADSLQLDFNGFLDKLDDNNYFDLGVNNNLLGFGFALGKNHFTFDVSHSLEMRLNFSKGLFDLVANGTDCEGHSIDVFSDEIIGFTDYISVSAGYSRDINEKLTVGANLKMYLGLANISTERADVKLDFNNDKISTMSDIVINTSNPYLRWNLTGNGAGENIFSDGGFEHDVNFDAMKNMGFGFDLGASYKLNDAMEFSFALVDVGFINWKSNATTIQSKHPNTPVEFSGIQSSFDNIGDDLNTYLEDLGDSLMYAFDLETVEGNGYKTMVPTKIYLGYSWEFAKRNYLHALYKGRFIAGKYENTLMVDYSFHAKWFQVSLGNTFASSLFNPNVFISLADVFYIGTSFANSLNLAKTTGFAFYTGINIPIKAKTEKKE